MGVVLVVRNGKIILPETGPITADLIVKDGRIAEINSSPEVPSDAKIVDAKGCIVLPGLVDPHIHHGWLAPLEDRMRRESAFGVSGGVTTFIRYIRHTDSYLKLVNEQIELGNRIQYQDFAFHLTIFNYAQVEEIPQYIEQFGVTSFKIYTNMKGPLGRGVLMDLRPGQNQVDAHDVDFNTALLSEVFRILGESPARCRLNVHCEDGETLASGIERAKHMGLDNLGAWHFACSDLAEALSINQVALLSRAYGVPVYFPHIGSRAAIQALLEAQSCGTNFVAETCPHYLTLTTDSPAGLLAKIMPPIRTIDDQNAVWLAVRNGLIETIGSDHVAYTLAEKNPTDIWSTRPAFPGTGLILPLLLSEGVARKRLSLQQLVKITSFNSARTFGLYPHKGTLLPGSDADFVIVDPNQTWRIAAKDLMSTSDFSVYENMEIRGAIKSVYLRGSRVFENGQLIDEEGRGKYIRR